MGYRFPKTPGFMERLTEADSSQYFCLIIWHNSHFF